MTTIRLINAGGSAASHYHACDRTGSSGERREKRKNRGLYVRESTVYSAYSENERKRGKR